MAVILGLDHAPLPPSDITERLGQIDPHLGLKWGEGLGSTPGWWLIYRWPENDPRRRMIAQGHMHPDDAFDFFEQLPLDCTVEQAYGYVTTALRGSAHPEAKRLYGRTGEFNKRHSRTQWDPVLNEALNQAEVMGHRLFEKEYGSVPKVRMSEPKARKRGKTAKEL